MILGTRWWLPALAHILIVDQAPVPADAILVLTGGNGSRQDYAIALYEAGYAPVIITSGGRRMPPDFEQAFAELAAEHIVRRGTPREAVMLLNQPTTTYEEALSSLQLAQERGFSSLLVVTDSFHTRRSRLTFQRVYRGSNIALTVVAARPDWFIPDSWWTQEASLSAVLGEYEKLVFYLLKGYLS